MNPTTDEILRTPHPENAAIPARQTHFTPPSHIYQAQPRARRAKQKRNWRETLLRRCTIGGLLLAAVLSMNVIDSAPTNAAMAFLRQAAASDIVQNTTAAVSSFWDSARATFGMAEPAAAMATPPGQTPPAATQKATARPQNTGGTNRIDEDILDRLHNAPDPYTGK